MNLIGTQIKATNRNIGRVQCPHTSEIEFRISETLPMADPPTTPTTPSGLAGHFPNNQTPYLTHIQHDPFYRIPFETNVMPTKTEIGHGYYGKTGHVSVGRKICDLEQRVTNAISHAKISQKTANLVNAVEEYTSTHNTASTVNQKQIDYENTNIIKETPYRKQYETPQIKNSISTNRIPKNIWRTISNKEIPPALTPYTHFKLPTFFMNIGGHNMKVLFDSGSSVSILTQKGKRIITETDIKPTNVNVWAANNQKLKLGGEIMLTLNLQTPIDHKFLISQNDISGCHALLGTDLYSKLDSFSLTGFKDLGITLCINNSLFSFNNKENPEYIYIIFSEEEINPIATDHCTYIVKRAETEEINKLLDEDFETNSDILPINDIQNGFTPDIPTVSSNKERMELFEKMIDNLDLQHLKPPTKNRLITILKLASQLFITTPNDPVGLIPNCVVRINTSEGEPIRAKQRKFSPLVAAKVKQMNVAMISRGIIELSKSQWSNPIVLVKRPGASTSLRMCLDLRELNKRIQFDSYPIGDIKSILQSVSGYKIYTTLDISEAYFCMLIHPDDRYKLAYRTPDGLYQFCRLPFGILTGCALWNRKFQEILSELGDENLKAYFDDLIIFTNDEDSHLALLNKVLKTLLKAGLRIKLTKCQLVKGSVKFLGLGKG